MRKWLWVIGITVLVLFIVSFVGGYWFQWGWTGFPVKTGWDWLNLLAVLAIPAVVGLGAAWYTAQQEKVTSQRGAVQGIHLLAYSKAPDVFLSCTFYARRLVPLFIDK